MAGQQGETIPAQERAPGSDRMKQRSGIIQVVEFMLGGEHYAIDLFDVREVVEYTPIIRIPKVPSYLRGIIDLRGEITTIVDLRQRLNLGSENAVPREASRIIVLDDRITHSKMGILVDDVTSVSTFEQDQVDVLSASVNTTEAGILGIIKRKVRVREKEINELIIWIDIRNLLSDLGDRTPTPGQGTG